MAATKQVEIPASMVFTTPNYGPNKCAAKAYLQFQAWDTESKWEIHYMYRGSPRVKRDTRDPARAALKAPEARRARHRTITRYRMT